MTENVDQEILLNVILSLKGNNNADYLIRARKWAFRNRDLKTKRNGRDYNESRRRKESTVPTKIGRVNLNINNPFIQF